MASTGGSRSVSMIGFYINGLNTDKKSAKIDRDRIRSTFNISVKLCYNHSCDRSKIKERIYNRPLQTIFGLFCGKDEPCGLMENYQAIQEAKKDVANSLKTKIAQYQHLDLIFIFAHSQGADVVHELFHRRSSLSLPKDKISILAFGGMTLIPSGIRSDSSVSANLVCKRDMIAKGAQIFTNNILGMKAFNIQISGQEPEKEVLDCDGHGMTEHYLSSSVVIARVRSIINSVKEMILRADIYEVCDGRNLSRRADQYPITFVKDGDCVTFWNPEQFNETNEEDAIPYEVCAPPSVKRYVLKKDDSFQPSPYSSYSSPLPYSPGVTSQYMLASTYEPPSHSLPPYTPISIPRSTHTPPLDEDIYGICVCENTSDWPVPFATESIEPLESYIPSEKPAEPPSFSSCSNPSLRSRYS